MEHKAGLDSGQSIDRCWMTLKTDAISRTAFPFQNKTAGQFTLTITEKYRQKITQNNSQNHRSGFQI
jgi:hypothetical protein